MTSGLLDILAESLNTKMPTRFVCLIPSQEFLPKPFLELISFRPGSPLFGYDQHNPGALAPCACLWSWPNKESLLVDPIDWDCFSNNIFLLANDWPPDLVSIPKFTDALFRERAPLSHSPRTLSKGAFNETSVPVISFFSTSVPRDQIRPNKIPLQDSKLINRMNHHPCFLSVLGILPNAFRSLLTLHKHQHKEEALLEIRRSLFFAGYRIWSKRKNLHSRFWRDIAPQNRKSLSKKRTKKKKAEDKLMNQSVQMHFISSEDTETFLDSV